MEDELASADELGPGSEKRTRFFGLEGVLIDLEAGGASALELWSSCWFRVS